MHLQRNYYAHMQMVSLIEVKYATAVKMSMLP